MVFRQNKAGEWIMPIMSGYKMACCDCGLVHQIDFAVVDKDERFVDGLRVAFRVYRLNKKGKVEDWG